MGNLSCGIVGLPNVGKSTLFNSLIAKMAAEASNYPFCTIEPNVGVVEVYDPRLEVLSKISGSHKIIYATMEFHDIAGLVKGASQGEGLGNKFLANIRQADAIIHVVRCFESEDIIHVAGQVDPIKDIEVINLELILADLQMADNIYGRIEKQVKARKELVPELAFIGRIREQLNNGLPVRALEMTEEEKRFLVLYPFLTSKKVLYLANVAEKDLPEYDNPWVRQVIAYAEKEGNRAIPFCAKIEEEIAQLPKAEQKDFLESVGLTESGLNRLVRTSFEMLGLISYLTTGEMETRAWPIRRGMNAMQAAGEIHTDLQKGFIRAEVVSYTDMVAYQGRTGAKEVGKMRSEGRDYIVQDGDVILFLHKS